MRIVNSSVSIADIHCRHLGEAIEPPKNLILPESLLDANGKLKTLDKENSNQDVSQNLNLPEHSIDSSKLLKAINADTYPYLMDSDLQRLIDYSSRKENVIVYNIRNGFVPDISKEEFDNIPLVFRNSQRMIELFFTHNYFKAVKFYDFRNKERVNSFLELPMFSNHMFNASLKQRPSVTRITFNSLCDRLNYLEVYRQFIDWSKNNVVNNAKLIGFGLLNNEYCLKEYFHCISIKQLETIFQVWNSHTFNQSLKNIPLDEISLCKTASSHLEELINKRKKNNLGSSSKFKD